MPNIVEIGQYIVDTTEKINGGLFFFDSPGIWLRCLLPVSKEDILHLA